LLSTLLDETKTRSGHAYHVASRKSKITNLGKFAFTKLTNVEIKLRFYIK